MFVARCACRSQDLKIDKCGVEGRLRALQREYDEMQQHLKVLIVNDGTQVRACVRNA